MGYSQAAAPITWQTDITDIPMAGKLTGRTNEFKGSVFLLPTVSPEEAEEYYPGYHTCDLPSKKPYLRLVKADDVSPAAPADPSPVKKLDDAKKTDAELNP